MIHDAWSGQGPQAVQLRRERGTYDLALRRAASVAEIRAIVNDLESCRHLRIKRTPEVGIHLAPDHSYINGRSATESDLDLGVRSAGAESSPPWSPSCRSRWCPHSPGPEGSPPPGSSLLFPVLLDLRL